MSPTDPVTPKHDDPFVFSADGIKSLYFTLDQLQSRMLCDRPTQLDLDYTRTMMGFLMFYPDPLHIAMIGLGGGSLLKFCYQHLPKAQFTVIEINPQVIQLRHEFEVPDDEDRITLVCADGADAIRNAANNLPIRFDVLLVDGFDSQGQALSLCSQRFYDDCFNVLAPDGVLAVNLHHDHPDHGLFTGRIRLAFDGHLREIAVMEKSNSIVFACKGPRIPTQEFRQTGPLENFDVDARTQLQAEFLRIALLIQPEEGAR